MSEWKADDVVSEWFCSVSDEKHLIEFGDLKLKVQASLQASAAKDEAIRQLKAELEAERAKH